MKEYKVLDTFDESDEFVIENLNKLNVEGWEVVCSFGFETSYFLLSKDKFKESEESA